MILPEDRPESPSKLPQLAETVESVQDAPPAYPGHEAGSSRIAAGPPPINERQPLNQQEQPIYVPVYVKPDADATRRAKRRFFKAFFIAFFIYIVFWALVKSIFDIAFGPSLGNRYEHEDAVTAQPRPPDGKILSCIKGADHWADHDGHLMTTFKLDRWSDKLYLFSRGMHLTGDVAITLDESVHQPDAVMVDVIARSHTSDWLHAVQVCSLERKKGEQGVGLFSPTRWRSQYRLPELEFGVVIRVPMLKSTEPFLISSLETDLPNFSHHIGDLGDQVLFRNLSLKSTNSHVSAQSVTVTNAQVITTNSRIVGDFRASESLELVTSNDLINVTATMTHINPDSSGPVLRMKTSNRQIISAVNLVSNLPTVRYRSGGSFNIEANTSNARLALDFPTAPVDSVVNVLARTSNMKATINMHPTWEGEFQVTTSNEMVAVYNSHPADPSGKGREKRVTAVGSWQKSEGVVLWDGTYMGSLRLHTSNAPVELYV
ncbi:hypothetical protein PHLGIDRAFT_126598 [Phlebiopsis gigantea 11061_1 CR5-6]|uniref:Uncharacterized protein n=1 Tax=Phlebiopsis gigantea (strain 11061_1 CR5-6) TaxID=745531 RepID=A0A0C3SCP2_PHLG1|nr:hypothetical protein PHLGIDRAFT_126598 [Phlebiopsis gigantea 11061_1 CR5-6]